MTTRDWLPMTMQTRMWMQMSKRMPMPTTSWQCILIPMLATLRRIRSHLRARSRTGFANAASARARSAGSEPRAASARAISGRGRPAAARAGCATARADEYCHRRHASRTATRMSARQTRMQHRPQRPARTSRPDQAIMRGMQRAYEAMRTRPGSTATQNDCDDDARIVHVQIVLHDRCRPLRMVVSRMRTSHHVACRTPPRLRDGRHQRCHQRDVDCCAGAARKRENSTDDLDCHQSCRCVQHSDETRR